MNFDETDLKESNLVRQNSQKSDEITDDVLFNVDQDNLVSIIPRSCDIVSDDALLDVNEGKYDPGEPPPPLPVSATPPRQLHQ